MSDEKEQRENTPPPDYTDYSSLQGTYEVARAIALMQKIIGTGIREVEFEYYAGQPFPRKVILH